MKFHYNGKYSGNEDDLPHMEHEPGAVPFKEPEDSKKLGRIANLIAILILIPLFVIYFVLSRQPLSIAGVVFYLLSLVPHEFLHALCFKDDVYMYTNLKHGMLFVVGPERMSKGRFIFMSLLPNIIFGFIPLIIFLIDPSQTALGTLAVLSIPSGAGDFFNVYNALTQMPKGAWTYLYKFHSYWYMPQESK